MPRGSLSVHKTNLQREQLPGQELSESGNVGESSVRRWKWPEKEKSKAHHPSWKIVYKQNFNQLDLFMATRESVMGRIN